MTTKTNTIDKVAELVIDLSADAHIQRREVAKDSPGFHSLTGAIAAYGRVLERLTILKDLEQLFAAVGQHDTPEHVVLTEGLSYVA